MIKRIGLNSLWLLVGRVSALGLNLFLQAILARRLGVEPFGVYAIFTSIIFVGNIFTTYGTDALLIREIARERRISASASAAVWLQILLAAIWLLLIITASFFFDLNIQIQISLIIINLALFPLAIQTVLNSILRAFERMNAYAALNVLVVFIQAVFAFFFIHTSDDFLLLCTLITISQFLTVYVGWISCKRLILTFVLDMRFVWTDVLEIIRNGWRLALFFPLSALYQRLNLFILSFLAGQGVTGLFSASARLVDGVRLGHFSVANSMMPSMARRESVETKTGLQKSFLMLLAWSIIAAIAIYFFAPLGIELVYGADYQNSIPVLKILGFVLIPYTFSIYFSLKLTMQKNEQLVLNANLICLPISILLYFLLISNFRGVGAAWGTLFAETIFAGALFFFGRKVKHDKPST